MPHRFPIYISLDSTLFSLMFPPTEIGGGGVFFWRKVVPIYVKKTFRYETEIRLMRCFFPFKRKAGVDI